MAGLGPGVRLPGAGEGTGNIPARKIRIPDPLWLPFCELAESRELPAAELIRQLMQRELENSTMRALEARVGKAPKRRR